MVDACYSELCGESQFCPVASDVFAAGIEVSDSVSLELMLMKVTINSETRSQILQLINAYAASIIEMNGKSEARVQIGRFVDENPEAVAQLLRNWLTEDWE